MDRQCLVCSEYGCSSKNHYVCSICGIRGHNKKTCPKTHRDLGEERNESTTKVCPIDLKRDSTSALLQGELDMSYRMLFGIFYGGQPTESKMEMACRLSGLGMTTMVELRRLLEAGLPPQAKEDKRGRFQRDQPRLLFMKMRKTVEALHKAGIMATVPKLRFELDAREGILLSDTTIRKVLHNMGYMFRTPSAQNVLLAHENKERAKLRLDYLRLITAARKVREVVYVDESYVNQRHQSSKCWVAPDSKVLIPAGKGKRYILYGAGSKNGWVGTPVIFPYSDTGDYHNAMNSSHFEELFKTTCEVAEEQLGPSVLLLDNAAYHKRLTSEKDRITYWQKTPAKEVLAAWERGEVPGKENYEGTEIRYKKQIIDFLRKNPPHGECVIKKMAEEHGHIVLFLPPYRPELNGIETAWGVVKNYVARENYPSMTFADLLNIIKKGWSKATMKTWVGIDGIVAKEEEQQLAEMETHDNRREVFREEHPDLMFRLEDDSDDDDLDEALIDELAEGVNGEEQEEETDFSTQKGPLVPPGETPMLQSTDVQQEVASDEEQQKVAFAALLSLYPVNRGSTCEE